MAARQAWFRWLALCLCVLGAGAHPASGRGLAEVFGPCRGDCAVSLYGGQYLQTSLTDVVVLDAPSPLSWDFQSDYFIGTAVSRDVARLWRFDLEPEVGIGQRFGEQSATEVWAALFFRYRGFPWDDVITTTIAFSTGFNYASEITEIERERARDKTGSQLMHYFSPEITFALPSRPDLELMFRIHHRSGVFGLVSDAFGGAQYGTVGLRVRF